MSDALRFLEFRLAFSQVAVKTDVLQRDRRLRRQQFQDRDSIRGESDEVNLFSR